MSENQTSRERTPPARPAFPGSPPTPNWRRCPATSWSSSAASSTASRPSTRTPRWPVEGTKAEKRAERSVAYWLLLGGFSGLALLLVFLFWPWEYKPYGSEGEFLYSLATPLYGLTFGLSILAIGIGAVLFQKKFIPEEIPIQDRHDGRSPEIQRKTVAANLTETLESSTLKRRKLIGMSLGIGLGAFGLGTLVAFAGGLIKNPWKPVVPTAEGKKAVLWTSGWTPRFNGETIFLARATGNAGHGVAVRQDAPRGPRRRRHGDRVPVAGVRRRRHHRRVAPPAQRDRDGRSQPGHAHPHQARRHATRSSSARVRRASTSATCSPHQGLLAPGLPLFALRATDLSHPVPVPPVAVRRVALRDGPYSVRLRALWRSCPSPLTRTGIWSPTATSSSPSDRHSGSGAHESEIAQTAEHGGNRSRPRRRDRFALPPLGGGTPAAEQGVPDPLVVPAG